MKSVDDTDETINNTGFLFTADVRDDLSMHRYVLNADFAHDMDLRGGG